MNATVRDLLVILLSIVANVPAAVIYSAILFDAFKGRGFVWMVYVATTVTNLGVMSRGVTTDIIDEGAIDNLHALELAICLTLAVLFYFLIRAAKKERIKLIERISSERSE